MAAHRLIFVGGGSRSGKSSFALAKARRLGARRLFVATAEAGDEEMRERIKLHRRSRGADFETIEETIEVPEAIRARPGYDVVLIDCLTLWLANLLLELGDPDAVLKRVDDLTRILAAYPGNTIVVTNEVGLGIVPESALGRTFRDLAGSAHQRVSRQADEIYLGVLGVMLRLKPSIALVEREELGP